MKTWLTPTAVEDKFIPNEAVSTCYALACDYDDANTYENWYFGKYNVIHGESGCGNAKKSKVNCRKW